MAASVVQSGDYLLELSTGWNWNAFHLADFATTQTRTNLVVNPSFETNSTGWVTNSANVTISRITTDGLYGSACLQVTGTNPVNSNGASTNTTGGRQAVVEGQPVTASAYVKVPAGQPTVTLDIDLFFYTALTGGSTLNNVDGGNVTVSSSDGWVRVSVTGTGDSGTNASAIRVAFAANVTGSTIFLVDGVLVEQTNTLRPYFDGTYYDQPYTGYSYISNAWTGTANASTSTSVWGLNTSNIYPESTLNNSTYVLDGTETFADITEYVTEVAYRRGRRKIDDQFGAGTMSFRMTDETGILGPYDTASPYYDPANDKPGLAPMRRVRLSRASEYLFVGYVIAYNYEFALAGPNAVQVTCADDFYLLAQTQLAAFNPSAETSGERIETVLALPEVNYTGTTSIDTGTVNLGHDASYNVPAGTNTLQYITQINQAEQGRVFISRAGVLTFQPRIGNTLSSPVIVFADDGTNTPYDAVDIEFDADGVINRAYVQALDGKTATAEDLSSQGTYFIQSQSLTNSLLHLQGEVDDLADYLLEPEPGPRFTAVSTNFALLDNTERADAATVDIGDTITITKDITGLSSLTSELSIEGIEGIINFATGHRITYYTAPTTVVYQLILDDAVFGQLDGTNVLG